MVPALTDTDGSETLSLTIGAVPVGAILTDGTRSFTAISGNTTVAITGWTWSNLSIKPPAGFTGNFVLSVTATATEAVANQTASTSKPLTVTVLPKSVTSPIVLDLNGDGVHTTALGETEGTFDLLNTGYAIASGWISSEDAFLAFDRNHNGIIDDRSELFGGNIGEGFAKLAEFDTNGDGQVSNLDLGFSGLLLWQDKNSNHQTDAGELTSLSNAGVASLNTGYEALPALQNGNVLLERSVATWTDGRSMEMVDVYFRVDERPVRTPNPEPVVDKSAAITIKSTARAQSFSFMGQHGPLFVADGIVSAGQPAGVFDMPVIDWSGSAGGRDNANVQILDFDNNWVSDFLGTKAKKKDLVAATGLKIILGAKGTRR
jgi:hypothetical protein